MSAVSQTLGLSKGIKVNQMLTRGRGGERCADTFGNPAGFSLAIDQDDGDFGIDQRLIAAPDRLAKHDPRAGELADARLHFEQVVDPRRLEEIGMDAPDR